MRNERIVQDLMKIKETHKKMIETCKAAEDHFRQFCDDSRELFKLIEEEASSAEAEQAALMVEVVHELEEHESEIISLYGHSSDLKYAIQECEPTAFYGHHEPDCGDKFHFFK